MRPRRAAPRRLGFAAALTGLLAILLGACTSTPTAPERAPDAAGNWLIQGKVSLRQRDRSGTVALRWRQQGDRFRLRIADRLGRQLAEIEGDGARVAVHQPGAAVIEGPLDATLDAFVQAQTGIRFPLRVLPWWLQGRPAPYLPAEQISEGVFRQAGYRVERGPDWPEGPLRARALDGSMLSARASLGAYRECTDASLDGC